MNDADTAAITRILARAHTEGADPTWTATAILDALRRRGWRPVIAQSDVDWRQHQPGTPPTQAWHDARAQLTHKDT